MDSNSSLYPELIAISGGYLPFEAVLHADIVAIHPRDKFGPNELQDIGKSIRKLLILRVADDKKLKDAPLAT